MPDHELRGHRLESIDVLRGIVMVLMALDHVRDFFGVPGVSPTNLQQTTAALFFTRWVTHFCAPVFFLLTGTGAYLRLRGRTKREVSEFLFKRGAWLLLLELVVLRGLAWQFNFDYRLTMLVILWALGWAMIVLAGLLYLPTRVVAMFGALMIGGHNLLDGVRPAVFGRWAPLWIVFHGPGFVYLSPTRQVFAAYPLIPWIGVTAVGYGLGQIYGWEQVRRRRLLLRLGGSLTLAFALLRAINVYGDPKRWTHQGTVLSTVLSFLNLTKYPPSLLFLLMTLGPALLVLWALERGTPAWLRPAIIFGRVPLFFFAAHAMLVHLLAVVVCAVRYHHVHWMFESPDVGHYPSTPPPGWGFGLTTTYGIWACVVLALYPVCRWFADLKRRRTEAWLSYL